MPPRLLAAVLAAVAGCSGPPTAAVRGTVTFDGRPVKSGTVVFDPDPAKGSDAAQGTAEIADGRYDTAAPGGRSPGPGPVVARVSVRGDPAAGVPAALLMVRDFKVTADLKAGPNTLDVAVPKSAQLPKPSSQVVDP